MKKNFVKSILGATLALSLSACTSPTASTDSPSLGKIDVAGVANDSNIPSNERAEKLALAAEQLLTLQGFAYAEEVADLSLSIDPQNLRARFVKAVLAPISPSRGLATRIRPLALQDEETYQNYLKEMAVLDQEIPNSAYKDFMLDGKEDIKSESDLQVYVDKVVKGFESLRKFAKENKGSELTVRASDAFLKDMVNRHNDGCQVIEEGPYSYSFTSQCPSWNSLMEVKLNRADFEMIQQVAGGMELWFSLINAYSLDGAMKVGVKHKDKESAQEEVISDLLQDNNFGILRESHGLAKVLEMGPDFVSAARWVMNNQNTLCPRGIENTKNRLGMLINRGICVERSNMVEKSKQLSEITDVINGRILRNVELEPGKVTEYDPQTHLYKTTKTPGFVTDLRPISIFEKPIVDLRSVRPTRYNECGKITGIADATLGGIFVKEDYNKFLEFSNSCK